MRILVYRLVLALLAAFIDCRSTSAFQRSIASLALYNKQLHASIGDGAMSESMTNSAATVSSDLPAPNLRKFPANFRPTYEPLPIWIRVALLTIFISAYTILPPLLQARRQEQSIHLFYVYFKYWWRQHILVPSWRHSFSPTRIPTSDLKGKYYLPSTLSRYDSVKLPYCDDLNVHYLIYDKTVKADATADRNSTQYEALYLNHGFGASSLSWLPAIPLLADVMNIKKVALAHDAPGFGFTDRPAKNASRNPFTFQYSAAIGAALLRQQVTDGNKSNVLLMGHSMGTLTTLHMALELSEFEHRTVVLVSPALGLTKKTSEKKQNRKMFPFSIMNRLFQRFVVDTIGRYVLKRAVGTPGFWRKGLSVAWGDSSKLSDSDVLRFQWPSIGQGWEQGLISFARSRQLENSDSDDDLLQEVLNMPNTTVYAVIGEKDRVIPSKGVYTFLKKFPAVKVVEIPGVGHDSFEENVPEFVSVIKKLLRHDES